MTMFSSEGEDYWNQSNVSAFSFDDEASGKARAALEELNRVLPSSESVPEEDQDQIEVVDWTGTKINAQVPFVSTNSAAVRFTTSRNSLSSGSSFQTQNFPASKRIGASLSPEPIRRVTSAGSSVGSIGSEDSSQGQKRKKELSPADQNRLDSEYKKLRLKFENLRRERYNPPDIRETIRRLSRGETAILELYRRKDDKLKLLQDALLKSGDGNVVTQVVLYLHQSLSAPLFHNQLIKHPSAANHYVTYLRDHFKFDELLTTLYSLGRNEEAAMVEFRQAIKRQNVSAKIQGLKRALQSSFSADPILNPEAILLSEYVSLLERQQPIDESDDSAARSGKNLKFRDFPKAASLLDQPTLTTLYYCCLYHYDLPQNSFASPLSMRQHHNLTEKQFCWVAIKALCRQKRWIEIDKLLTSRRLLGLVGPKIKTVIPAQKLLENMEKHSASREILGKYLSLASGDEERLKLAVKYKCYQQAIEGFVNGRDRQALIRYAATLTAHTKESYSADAAINNSAIKWKN